MTIYEQLIRLLHFLNTIVCYLTMKLGRGVLLSYALLFIVLFLRRGFSGKSCFLKGFVWSLFLWLPFVGGLRFFYETKCGIYGFYWWVGMVMENYWIGWLYFAVMLVYGGYLCYRRKKLWDFVKKLEHFSGNLYVSGEISTPFATGLLSPRIVLPRVMLEQYGREEIDMILLHERTHIRLGHLWCYFLWDVLQVLFWPNIFLTFCGKMMREDLEEICDRVTIQKSGKDACDYGRLLLRSMRIVQSEGWKRRLPASAGFTGGAGAYAVFRKRIENIMDFRRYRRFGTVLLILFCCVFLAGGFWQISQNSYARYTELEDILVYDMSGKRMLLEDSERLRRAVTFDRETVYIRGEELEELLAEKGVEEEEFFVLFGGFMKQPGIGGGGDYIYVERAALDEGITKIEYEHCMDWMVWMIKVL